MPFPKSKLVAVWLQKITFLVSVSLIEGERYWSHYYNESNQCTYAVVCVMCWKLKQCAFSFFMISIQMEQTGKECDSQGDEESGQECSEARCTAKEKANLQFSLRLDNLAWQTKKWTGTISKEGDAQSCHNYRGIKLSFTMKIWERVVEAKLKRD